MSNTLATSPQTMADDATVGTVAWTDPDNAKVSDDVYAYASGSGITSHYLKATNFGFAIPTGAIISGILIEVEKYAAGATTDIKDSAIKIVKADGSIGTTNKANTTTQWPTTEAYISHGSSTDLWGEIWTAENINDADFGLVISTIHGAVGNKQYANVDHIRITVYYTETGGNFFQLF